MRRSGLFNQPIPLTNLITEGVRKQKIFKKDNKNKPSQKSQKPNYVREKFKYTVQLLRSLNDEDYKEIGSEVKRILDEADGAEGSDMSSQYFTIADVTRELMGVEQLRVEQFMEMAEERRQIRRNRRNPSAFSLVTPAIPSAVEAIPNASPETWRPHQNRTFQQRDDQNPLPQNELACHFFGCHYIGSSSTMVHHYVNWPI